MTLDQQVRAVRKLLSDGADQDEVRKIVARFNHNNGLYQFHKVAKADKKLAGMVRSHADRLIDLIFKEELTPLKAKLATRQPPVTLAALTELSRFALSVETERLAETPGDGTGNVDRTDRRLAIDAAKRLLDMYPPKATTNADIARLAATINGEPSDDMNYRPLVAKAKKQGAI